MADIGGQLRALQQRQHHYIETSRQLGNAIWCQGFRRGQHAERTLGERLCQAGSLGRVALSGIQYPDKAALFLGGCYQRREGRVAAVGGRDPGEGLSIHIGLLLHLAGTVDQPAKAHVDADRAKPILVHSVQQVMHQAVVAAVGALQGFLGVGKKVLLLRPFGQRRTHIYVVAQLSESAAADVPHRTVGQCHGKAAGCIIIQAQSGSLAFVFLCRAHFLYLKVYHASALQRHGQKHAFVL